MLKQYASRPIQINTYVTVYALYFYAKLYGEHNLCPSLDLL